MRKTHVPAGLRRLVAEQARHRCGYCLTPEALTGVALEVEHILPEALGGDTAEENL
jgi:5-methylcytosine-specific restriction endonuclease McrA